MFFFKFQFIDSMFNNEPTRSVIIIEHEWKLNSMIKFNWQQPFLFVSSSKYEMNVC